MDPRSMQHIKQEDDNRAYVLTDEETADVVNSNLR
jgi:hypothetical protein